ncbi:molybdenum cofactor biosynthesis protein MoaE [Candidimonas sp. SYP-B2681]|uniref:molybdenum cofactor biosynthesis protein MoaE n=1 Tax=Candidimonas sp. SYP-B2681 TaxID=2497686 RepID=UPI000F8859EE|nr:molybdenum cofactor biosynthesis protein MoaE [Candidimonas sp. SYP-B2681]RTZ40696.1 molybdenum cofactor biosynthesis protein MoaE [Candidimonas sp. SYP-B2681]
MVVIQEADFDVATLLTELRAASGSQSGAIVTFTGYVRDYAKNANTQSLFLDHYPGMCEREIEALCVTARSRWDVLDCTVVHRVGELQLKDQIVFVGVASTHRGDAFAACEFLIDALKTRAPFWKRETLTSGEQFWVQQRDSDVSKTDKWDEPSAA